MCAVRGAVARRCPKLLAQVPEHYPSACMTPRKRRRRDCTASHYIREWGLTLPWGGGGGASEKRHGGGREGTRRAGSCLRLTLKVAQPLRRDRGDEYGKGTLWVGGGLVGSRAVAGLRIVGV